MKAITAYRRVTDAGLQIDLSADKQRLLIYGPRHAKRKLMPLLKNHCSAFLSLLIGADGAADRAIRAAMESARLASPRAVRDSTPKRRASQGGV